MSGSGCISSILALHLQVLNAATFQADALIHDLPQHLPKQSMPGHAGANWSTPGAFLTYGPHG